MDWFVEMKRITRAYLEIHGLPVADSLKGAQDDDPEQYDNPEQYADEKEQFDQEKKAAQRERDYRRSGDRG